jgi:drug/metabolite transporter (DMT)-like permease
MAGVVVTSTRLDFTGLAVVNTGDALAVAVGFCWALFIVTSRNIVKRYGPYDLSLGLCFWSTVLALPLVMTEPARISWSSAAPIVYLAVFTTILAYFFYLQGVRSVSPVATSIVILIEVVVAFGIARFGLSESFSSVESVGVVLVLAGVLLVVKR